MNDDWKEVGGGGDGLPVDRLPRFVEIPGFTNLWTRLGLTDADLLDVQTTIASRPAAGAVVAGTNGVRKLRYATREGGRGKSGAFRVFYLLALEHGVVFLVAALAKSDRENLTKAERNAVAKLAAALKAEFGEGSGS